LKVNSVATGTEVLHGEETAQSREQIPDAIDRLVIDLRTGSGEDNATLTRTAVPLAKDASANMDALQEFANGADLFERGQLVDAAAALERAVNADDHFSQAQIYLAEIYREQHAQVSSAAAAVAAQTDAQNASSRTQQLAAATYALDATGDLPSVPGIVAPLLQSYPNSVSARIAGALALTGQGKFSESFATVQTALQRNPEDGAATALAEYDLLGQERAEAARSMEESAARSGVAHDGLRLLTTYLNNGEQGPIDITVGPAGRVAVGETEAALLDAVGSQREALRLWQTVAAEAGTHPQLFSAAADVLSEAGLEQALLGDCSSSSTLIHQAQNYPLGPDAQSRVGIAAALCGDTGTARASADSMARLYPQSFAAKNVYTPELAAVIQWKAGSADAALATLQAAKGFDNISMVPFLRGEIHLKSGHPQEALLDFQVVVQHPGATALINPLLYPLAQIGLARAYAASGDKLNSGLAYQKFLTLWNGADSGSPLIAEAQANASH
jgi:tetratricopeptide (TPR) repeat protein